MYIWTVALRHLRTRVMSWISIGIIVLIVVLYLLIISVLEGFKEHYMATLRSVRAHMTAQVGDIGWGMLEPEKWAAELEKDPAIRGAVPLLEIPVLVLFDHGRTIGTLRGIDLDLEFKHGELQKFLDPKDLADLKPTEFAGRTKPTCIVGDYWRRKHKLKAGEFVTFLFLDEEGQNRAIQFYIKGFFATGEAHFETAAYVDRKYLARELGSVGRAKSLALYVKDDADRADLDDIRARAATVLVSCIEADADPDYRADFKRMLEVETWREKNGNLYYAIATENRYMRFIMAIFLLFVALIIMLILGQLVAEKIRDIGALRALGATPTGVTCCFLAQGLFISMIGLAVGLPLGYFLVQHVNEVAQFFNVNPFPDNTFLIDHIPTDFQSSDVVLISAMTLAAGFFGALLPALRAARMNPVECLRHE